jgi:L-lactate permease
VALLFYRMPVANALAAGVYGFFYGLWPIAWIIVAAVFLYKVSVKTGQFDIIRSSILSVTEDQRLQLILVGFCFGAFLEGAAGFGAPVAITAALLVGLGFRPLYAAGLCLIGNTAPVAFGAMGIPVIVAGQVSGVDVMAISQMAGRQLPFMTIIVLFWLMAIMDGWRGVKETWPAVLVGGGSFALGQFLTANYIGPELPDITSAIFALVTLTTFLKFWQPKRIFRFDTEPGAADPDDGPCKLTTGMVIKAWSPFIILTAMVTIWSLKPFKALFASGGALSGTVFSIPCPCCTIWCRKWLPSLPRPRPMARSIPSTGCRPRNRDPDRRRARHSFAAPQACRGSPDPGRDLQGTGPAHLLHRHGAGLRLHRQLLRPVHHAGHGAGPYRQGLCVLLALPGLGRRVPHGLRHLGQCAVRRLQATTAAQLGCPRFWP